jgi:hypothetical protein
MEAETLSFTFSTKAGGGGQIGPEKAGFAIPLKY